MRGLFRGEIQNVGVQSRNVAQVCHTLRQCEHQRDVSENNLRGKAFYTLLKDALKTETDPAATQ